MHIWRKILTELIILSGIAGIVGTGVGGVFGVFFSGKSERMLSCVLSFAAGVMVSIVCFDLIPESYNTGGNIFLTIASIIAGVCLIYLLNYIVDKVTIAKESKVETHTTLSEMRHTASVTNNESGAKKSLLKAGIIMYIAIALHNFPEGMAIGAGQLVSNGTALAIMIAIHNMPEGMSISAPLAAGGMGKTKACILTALSGAPTIIGAIIGLLLGQANPLMLAMVTAFAGGAMLYVIFGEILPESVLIHKGKSPTIFTLVGLILGYLMTELL